MLKELFSGVDFILIINFIYWFESLNLLIKDEKLYALVKKF